MAFIEEYSFNILISLCDLKLFNRHSKSQSLMLDYFFLYQREEEEEHYRLPGGVYTTAEPRPNAYIPDDDSELPIPRPYGSLAPFKPTEPGSTMRHIRKPVIKPIEI